MLILQLVKKFAGPIFAPVEIAGSTGDERTRRQTMDTTRADEIVKGLTMGDMLDLIDAFLVRDVGASRVTAGRDLWDVLSALRGPDPKQDYHLKPLTTARIRTKAFPRAAAVIVPYADFADPGTPIDVAKADSEAVASHFASHVYYAANALHAIGRS